MNMKKIAIFFSVLAALAAQDSAAVALTTDSLPADTATTDSVTVVEVSFSPTSYFSEYSISRKNEKGEQITTYRGNAKLIYEDMKIEAHQIVMNLSTKILVATPKIDTLESGKTEIIGLPVFTQAGNQPMYGIKIIYNFDQKRGRVFEGDTKVETAKYKGEYIRKFGEKTMLIRDGMFTTCLADSPSYWIHANKIRMIHGDKIFTGPLYMTIYDIPFPIPLPFGVFSMKKGRRSGVIIPSYYSGTTRGRGLQGLGYYWAASDQFQAKLLTDYYENTGFRYNLSTNFRDRYNYNGGLNAHYSPKDQRTGRSSPRYGFNFNYSHKIDPSLTVSGSGSFESSQSNTSVYKSFEKQSNQTVQSYLSATKRWDSSSLSSSMNHSKNLRTGQESYTFPSMALSVNSFPLFGEAKDPLNKTWYEKINVNYGSRLQNRWNNEVQADTLGNYSQIDEESRFGVEHTVSLSAPFKLFKYITVNPRINATETWVTRVREIDESRSDTLIVKEKDKFAALHTFSTGVSMSTNLYGMFEPNIGTLKNIRHHVAPSVSFNYRPDFSDESFGYTQTVTQDKYDQSVVRTRKDGSRYVDRFALSAYSTTPTNESLNASFSLKNTFSGKFIEAKDEEKLDLLSFTSRASYDFLKDSLQWSNLSTSFSFPFIKAVSFNGNMTHSLYKLTETGARRNEFVNFVPILTNFNFSMSYNLKDTDLYGKEDENDELTEEEQLAKRVEEFQTKTIPWRVGISSSYRYNKFATINKTQWTANINSSIDLTPKWHITHSTSVDLNTWEMQYQNYTVTRDLECWTFNFTYAPNPYNSYYLLTIRISDEMLKDIEYKRHSRNLPQY